MIKLEKEKYMKKYNRQLNVTQSKYYTNTDMNRWSTITVY